MEKSDEMLVVLMRRWCRGTFSSEDGGGEGSQSLHAAEIRAVREEHFKV